MMVTRYRNTDLDLISSAPLEDLTDELETAGMVLLGTHQDGQARWHAIFEILSEEDAVYVNAEATIGAMLSIIDGLSDRCRQLWSSCDLREFNVAYDVGVEPLAFNEGFSVETLASMSELKVSFRVTLYPERDDDT